MMFPNSSAAGLRCSNSPIEAGAKVLKPLLPIYFLLLFFYNLF